MIAQIENAMLERLKLGGASARLGYSWRTLDTYPENWDDLLKDSISWQSPAAWVVFGGFEGVTEEDAGGARARATFGVVVAAENMRNERATRHGGAGAAEPGSYQLMLDAAGLLIGRDFGLDIDRLELTAVRSVRPIAALKERKVSMWALLFRTTIPILALDPDGDPEGDFDIFHANWDVPAFGGVDADPNAPGIQLPADLQADATDHLELNP